MYDKLLKPRQSFRITLYINYIEVISRLQIIYCFQNLVFITTCFGPFDHLQVIHNIGLYRILGSGGGVLSNIRFFINMSKILLRSEKNNSLCFTDYFNVQKYTVPIGQVTSDLGR